MKRLASLAAGALVLFVLVATPAKAQPRFFFDQGYHAVGFGDRRLPQSGSRRLSSS